ncbi:MAG: hypothetical protein ABFD89_15275 [Bryobacteraceae bacterium]
MKHPNLTAAIVADLIENKGYSRKELLAQLGVGHMDPVNVSTWREGSKYPSEEIMVKLAELAGIDKEILLMDKFARKLRRVGIRLDRSAITRWAGTSSQ